MRRLLVVAFRWITAFGLDPRRFGRSLRGLLPALRDLRAFRDRVSADAGSFPIRFTYPCLHERYEEGGVASGAYFHQDLLVAQRVFECRPERHVDVGSRVDGFVAHVASFRPIEVFDIRPLTVHVKNIVFRQADLMNLPPEFDGICDSLSCLHVLEHMGLGRYGDPVAPDGHLRALCGLGRLLRPGGFLYVSVPVGRQRIDFNAHRVFALPYLLSLFPPQFELVRFALVDEAGALHRDVTPDAGLQAELETSEGVCCGILELRRSSAPVAPRPLPAGGF